MDREFYFEKSSEKFFYCIMDFHVADKTVLILNQSLSHWRHRHSLKPHQPGPWFNIKMSSYQNRKSHCGDKAVVRSSYLQNGISYTGKMSSLYWIRALHSLSSTSGIHKALSICIRQTHQLISLMLFHRYSTLMDISSHCTLNNNHDIAMNQFM